jgi:hypothetical protein
MPKPSIGKFLTFKFIGRKDNISGIVLDYNDNWTLLRDCSWDYQLDGYTIFKNDRVEYLYGDFEKRATKILKLKGYNFKKEPKIPIDNLASIFNFISKKYKLIQLDTRKGDACDVVSYLGEDNSLYLFDELTTNAKWRYKLKLPEKECRFISFDNDYLNSLKLITKFKPRH